MEFFLSTLTYNLLQGFTYDGSSPALLYGYGGFNVDVLPTFSAFNLAFMDHFDGVYASANIRGGA